MYEKIASFYDLIHADLTEDVDFSLALADQTGGPILELGCGTGRLLLPLARAGHLVTGLDRSTAMLDMAKQKLIHENESVQSRVTIVQGEMSSIQLEARFRLAIASYNTLMHLKGTTKIALLKNVQKHLQSGGTLYIDLDNPFEISDSNDDDLLILERTMHDPDTGDTIIQASSSWVDSDAQYRHITWLFDVSPQSGGPVSRTIVETDYHYLFPHELEIALVSAGFRLEALLGGYDQEPFSEESARLIALAKV